MPSPRIAKVSAEILETPLFAPFSTSQGTAHQAECLVIAFTLNDGRIAYGESTPVEYVTGETATTARQAVERAAPQLLGMETLRYRALFKTIAECAPAEPSARCGLEMAALNAWTLASGTSLATLWGGASDCVESDITIPIAPDAGVLAALAWSAGLRIFKIKVGGGTLQEDYDRIAAVREAAPNARIRIDANQAFSVADAIAFANRLLEEGTHLDFVEQPVRKDDFEGMAAVAAACPVPVFADESVRTPADALRLTQTPVGGFNCKINKNGIAGVLDIIAIAKASGRQLMLGCMLETRRSIAVSLALACGTGAFDYIDLDSHLLLNEAGANAHFEQEGAQLTLRAPKGD